MRGCHAGGANPARVSNRSGVPCPRHPGDTRQSITALSNAVAVLQQGDPGAEFSKHAVYSCKTMS